MCMTCSSRVACVQFNLIHHILFVSPLGVIEVHVFENNRQSGHSHLGTNCTADMGTTWWYNSSNKQIKLHTSSVCTWWYNISCIVLVM